MRQIKWLIAIAMCLNVDNVAAQYNPLHIPDTLTGTTFDLYVRDTFKQIVPGNQTITAAVNSDFWGPTLIVNKWDVIHPTVHNRLADTTTMHWHGIHLPAIMDGGPHQTIPPYTDWSPYWQVVDNAGTYWYHPHLDKETLKQIISGIGGLIIVRDSTEAALSLPRKYGVDDIPLVFTDRKFDAMNQFIIEPFGDSQLTNGVRHAAYTVPAQMVRFRLLSGSTERTYDIGFSDNRVFHVIGTDGGLLDTPVAVTRLMINEGERYEIVVNFTGQAGTTLDMLAYNSELDASGVQGVDTLWGPFNSALNNTDFNMLHIQVGPPTAGGVTTIPHHLTTNHFYPLVSAGGVRYLTMRDSFYTSPPDPTPHLWGFILNNHLFKMDSIDYKIPINRTEIWEINSTSFVAHPFHIHDVQFSLLSINGMAPPAHMRGWKDVVMVPANGSMRFITRFSDYSDSLHPYMFHCHIAMHEDDGMMGQFVVGNSPAGLKNVAQNNKMKLFPNPATSQLNFEMADQIIIRHATVISTSGQQVKEIDLDASKAALDLAYLPKGLYYLRLTDAEGGTYIKAYLMQ